MKMQNLLSTLKSFLVRFQGKSLSSISASHHTPLETAASQFLLNLFARVNLVPPTPLPVLADSYKHISSLNGPRGWLDQPRGRY